MLRNYLPFEEPLVLLEEKIAELKALSEQEGLDRSEEIEALEAEAEQTKQRIFSNLTAWDRVQMARHPKRPYTLDYVRLLCEDFVELHGDRRYADDGAIVAGLALCAGRSLVVVGHERGRTTRERQRRNFGSPHPEGYRKAMRVMKLGEKLGLPVVTFVDTSGAACLEEDEARGISESIAESMLLMSQLRVPIVVNIIGEGGSGGAIAIGVGDRVFMLENSTYSVIAPEGCASILWRDSARAPEAAEALRLTAAEAVKLGVADAVIPEPLGGAHRDAHTTAQNLKQAVSQALEELSALPTAVLLEQRFQKFRNMGLGPSLVPPQPPAKARRRRTRTAN